MGESILVDSSGTVHVVSNREDAWIHRGANSKEEITLADLSDETYFTVEFVDKERLQGKKSLE